MLVREGKQRDVGSRELSMDSRKEWSIPSVETESVETNVKLKASTKDRSYANKAWSTKATTELYSKM